MIIHMHASSACNISENVAEHRIPVTTNIQIRTQYGFVLKQES